MGLAFEYSEVVLDSISLLMISAIHEYCSRLPWLIYLIFYTSNFGAILGSLNLLLIHIVKATRT